MPAQKTEKAESREKGLTSEKKSQKTRPRNKDCPRIQNSLGEFVCQQQKLNKRTKQRSLWRKKEKKKGRGWGTLAVASIMWADHTLSQFSWGVCEMNTITLHFVDGETEAWRAESICPCHTADMWKKYAQNSRDLLLSFCFSEFPEVRRVESWCSD